MRVFETYMLTSIEWNKGEPAYRRWALLAYNQDGIGFYSEAQLYTGVAIGLGWGVGVDAAGGMFGDALGRNATLQQFISDEVCA